MGDSRLVQLLAQPGLELLAQRISLRCTLGSLEAEEVPEYIGRRVMAAGGSVEFDAEAGALVSQLSGGVPGIVNALCDRALSVSYRRSSRGIDASTIAAAAIELDLAPSPEPRSTMAIVTMGLILVLLLGLGAAAAAYVFRSRIAGVVSDWSGRRAISSETSNPGPPKPTPLTPEER